MRILFATTGGLGHFHPLVPLARAAETAGHAVAFACPKPFAKYVEASGFQALLGREPVPKPDPELMAVMAKLPSLPEREANALYYRRLFVDVNTRRSLRPLAEEVFPTWQPDVIVREGFEYASALVAEKAGIPHVTVQAGHEPHPLYLEDDLAEGLAPFREELGLRPDPTLAMLYPYLLLAFVPPSFQDPRTLAIPTHRALRPAIFDHSGDERLPGWVTGELPGPVVYLTMGTEMTRLPGIYPELFQRLIAGLHGQAGTLIVSVGRDMDPAALDPQPDNVYVERYIPQSLLFPYCALVVTHGGHNTVMAALSHGLPMLLVPVTADQPENAEHAETIGVGRAIAYESATEATVSNAARELLEDASYRTKAREVKAEMASLPGVDHGVELLERVVAG